MPSEAPCRTAPFFVLRSPSLPVEAFAQGFGAPWGPSGSGGATPETLDTNREAQRRALARAMERSEVREALALASPDLADRIDAWLAGALGAKDARNLEQALVKYLSRMASRPTPFGLFAGVSLGTWGPATRLELGPWTQARRSVRLDWGTLGALLEDLEKRPEVRALQVFRPNTSLYAFGGRHRYLESRMTPGSRQGFHLEAVAGTPHLRSVLACAATGASLQELARHLAMDQGVEEEAARRFLDLLVDAQVLCGDLQPALTTGDPLGHVVAKLQSEPATGSLATSLGTLARGLKDLETAAPGAYDHGHGALRQPLEGLGTGLAGRPLLQLDLHRTAPGLTLDAKVRRALEQGAETLRRLSPAAPREPLARFRKAFAERYGSRWVPLLEALDEEGGIGFDADAPVSAALLEGLPLSPAPGPSRPPLTTQEDWMFARLLQLRGGFTWELADADLEALANPEPPPFPASFAALACLSASSPEALTQGSFRFWMEQYSGPTAARWLGRFASGDAQLEEALKVHLRTEEAAHPDVVFAELIHRPEGRLGNVLARPQLRDHEIPFLARPGVADDRTILPSDLRVTVAGDRIFLASERLGREVAPRLSSAHNFTQGPAAYRFLAHLQDQDGQPGGWSWGALGQQPFLPRVTRGQQVLAKARWRVEAREVQAALAASPSLWGAYQALRASRSLPKRVVLADADNGLLVDLDQVLCVETLHQLVVGRPSFTLTECFPDLGQAVVTSSEGRFAHELVVPFEAPGPPRPALPYLPRRGDPPRARTFPPGSDWLYLKLYAGPASLDRLLREHLGPLLAQPGGEGLWDRWFFVRYWDPAPHLRLRLHGDPARLLGCLLPRLTQALALPLAEGLLWKLQVDTYEQEVERYGGQVGMALAETWFCRDSQAVLQALMGGLDPEARWRQGLQQVDLIWASLGLELPERLALAETSRDAFRKEFKDQGQGAIWMGDRFRGFRKALEAGFPRPCDLELTPATAPLHLTREALDSGLLEVGKAALAGTLAHMHLNRILTTEHRAHEWTIMEFMTRLYASSLARSRPASVQT
jgi:thiopeptide-type bacteriocin biosynthesis protein